MFFPKVSKKDCLFLTIFVIIGLIAFLAIPVFIAYKFDLLTEFASFITGYACCAAFAIWENEL